MPQTILASAETPPPYSGNAPLNLETFSGGLPLWKKSHKTLFLSPVESTLWIPLFIGVACFYPHPMHIAHFGHSWPFMACKWLSNITLNWQVTMQWLTWMQVLNFLKCQQFQNWQTQIFSHMIEQIEHKSGRSFNHILGAICKSPSLKHITQCTPMYIMLWVSSHKI